MSMDVSGKPSIHFVSILRGKEINITPFPFNQEGWHFFFSARYAIAAGIQSLGLKYGDEVLLPSYNCWTEIDPFLYLKFRPVFYRIKKYLDADLDDLLQKISSNVKAVLITHFLGFPQPVDQIKEICKERGLFLIEDCAHALLSSNQGKPLGCYGDIAIFSLLKTLPVPNGGVLLINNKNIEYTPDSKRPSRFATYFYAQELSKHATRSDKHSLMQRGQKMLYGGSYLPLSLLRLFLVVFRKYVNHDGLYLVRPDSNLFIEGLRDWGISDLSKNILNGQDFEKIKIIRRRNFEYLLNHFLKNKREILPFKSLLDGVCPLFFPLIMNSSVIRNNLYRVLKSRGITTHPWWNRFHPQVFWDKFPDAVYLKKRLFGLPIHQDLTFKHLDFLIKEFEKALEATKV